MERRRLYVGGISRKTITGAALQELLSKVCPVAEVYVPPQSKTGLGKDFAIVVLEGADAKELGDRCARCIKAFNNSLWKGSRLRVEHAREYFKDRMLKEKMEQEQLEEATDEDSGGDDDKADEMEIVEERGEFDADCLRLKRNRYSSAIEVNLLARVGSDSKAGTVLVDGNGRRLSGCKLLFDEFGDVTNYDTALFYDPGPAQAPGGETVTERKPRMDKRVALKAPSSSSAAEGMQGGGLRRGFGTLVQSGKQQREDDACCVEGSPGASASGAAAQARPLLDTFDGDDGDEPCLLPQDVTEEELFKERRRQLQAMAAMVGEMPTVAKPPASIIVMDDRNGLILDRASKYDSKKKQDQKRATKQLQQPEEPGGHANLTALKDIFHREGGVWWGDDGSLKSSVARGDAAQDRLFLEAEKLGFDIRTDDAEGKTMRFGFFDEEEQEQEMPGTAAVAAAQVTDTFMDVDNSGASSSDPPAPVAAPPSLLEVVRRARLFCREGTEEQVIERWKATRERLAADYKQKRKENRKKFGQKSVGVTAVDRSAADRGNSAALGGSQEKRFGKKAQQKRGGKKHAKAKA